jgi:hypothetical protein
MEEFVRFQDSQNMQRVYLAKVAELAYWEKARENGDSDSRTLQRTMQIIDAVGYHLIPLYRLVGLAAIIIILILFIVGMVRMLLDIIVRAIARVCGCSASY